MTPKPKIRKKYPQEAFQNAMKAVQNGMAKREAARRYGVPRSTLSDKISGKYRDGKGMGRDTFLSTAEENMIVE